MENKNNCLVCGSEVIYHEKSSEFSCFFCNDKFDANVSCEQGHYICDSCHSASAIDLIQSYCLKSKSTNPIELAQNLMKAPAVKMHGPEHHFLVPAVLLTAYYNKIENSSLLPEKLAKAKKRASNVLGGFCGFYGTCGAAIGSGIFMSLITNATPVTKESWKQSNMLTGECLQKVALSGGPRCCKRDSYICILETVKYLYESFSVKLDLPEKISCSFSRYNNECLHSECTFYNG